MQGAVAVFVLACCFGYVSAISIKVGVLLMTSSPWPFDLPSMGPAIDEGVDYARDYYGVDIQLIHHNYTGNCPLESPIGHLAELYYNHSVNAVIGPACSDPMVGAGRLAEFFNLPILTGLGDLVVRKQSNDDMFETLTLLSYSIIKLSSK